MYKEHLLKEEKQHGYAILTGLHQVANQNALYRHLHYVCASLSQQRGHVTAFLLLSESGDQVQVQLQHDHGFQERYGLAGAKMLVDRYRLHKASSVGDTPFLATSLKGQEASEDTVFLGELALDPETGNYGLLVGALAAGSTEEIRNQYISFFQQSMDHCNRFHRDLYELENENHIKLREATILKDKFQSIFNSSFSFIGFLDRNGILTEANATALDMAGIKRSDVVGKYFWDCYWWQISSQTQAELKEHFHRALMGQEVSYEVTVWVKEKREVTILFSLRPVKNSVGEVIFVIPEGRPIQDIVEAKKRQRLILEGAKLGTWDWDMNSDCLVINEWWLDYLEIPQEERKSLTREKWMMRIHPEDKEQAASAIAQYLAGKSDLYQVEFRLQHQSGHWIWVAEQGQVFEWDSLGSPRQMYGTLQDITRRKEREREIAYHRDLLSALYELSPIGIALNDFETGQFLDVNTKLLAPTQYTKEEFLALSYWDVTPKQYAPLEAIALEEMRNRGEYNRFEKEYRRKDGTLYPVELRGIVIEDLNGRKLIWSIIRDVIEEKAAEEQLKTALSKLQAVLDASTQVAIIGIDLEGKITLFNAGAERLLHYSSADVLHKKQFQQLLLQEELEALSTELQQQYGVTCSPQQAPFYEAQQDIFFTREFQLLDAHGALMNTLLSITKLAVDGEHTGYLGVLTNISGLKNVEQQMTQLLERTKSQNERLKNFAHIVAHNLRSHSAGLIGMLELLEMEKPELLEVAAFPLLQQGANNLEQTVEDLTEIVRMNLAELQLKQVDLHASIENNCASIRALLILNKVQVINQVPKNTTVTGIQAYIDSIVLNFITNAVKYKRPEAEGGCQLRIFMTETDTHKIVHFEDNGIGIDMKQNGDKLFGLYKTFHKHPDARGVGLFLTKGQVEAMGGFIGVQSTKGQGTTFEVHFPLT